MAVKQVLMAFMICMAAGLLLTANARPPVSVTLEQWLAEGAEYQAYHEDVPSLILFYAEQQKGIPYISGLLDRTEEETLVVTLDGTDCVIFVEMSLALAATTIQNHRSYSNFKKNLATLRYVDGRPDGYLSRLHYVSDWMYRHHVNGRLTLLFQDEHLPVLSPVSFMSQHRERYSQLAGRDSLWIEMKQIEKTVSGRRLFYIRSEDIEAYQSSFETGDVLAFVSRVDGLDIAHTALMVMKGGESYFIHAGLTDGVTHEKRDLNSYLDQNKQFIGVIMARFNADGWKKGE